MLVNQNGPSEAKGVFDLTNWTTPKPFWHGTNYCLFLPTGEVAPQGVEGLGSSNVVFLQEMESFNKVFHVIIKKDV
ncbi:hypothetical protein B5P41_29605 [Bacillus sp. SRB_28]|nr:hypothetical protein B5P41_29605 [Bacillus sp. SRB_28]